MKGKTLKARKEYRESTSTDSIKEGVNIGNTSTNSIKEGGEEGVNINYYVGTAMTR